MNCVKDYEQNRNDFNNTNVKNTTLFGADKFNCKKCKDLCASFTQIQENMLEVTAVVSTVIKLLQAGLKRSICEITFSHSVELHIHTHKKYFIWRVQQKKVKK